MTKQLKSPDELTKELQARYGWTLADYQKKVMVPYILQNKLVTQLSQDEAGKKAALEKAQKVLAELKGGADFAALAKKYSDDISGQNGGDLDWFGKGEMVQPFEDAAFALKPGEYTQNLVETQYGYHIIKVTDRKTEKVKDAKGKTVTEEKVKASHILISFPSLKKYMDDSAKNMTAHLYIKVHNPFTELQK